MMLGKGRRRGRRRKQRGRRRRRATNWQKIFVSHTKKGHVPTVYKKNSQKSATRTKTT